MRKSTWLHLIDGLASISMPDEFKRQFEELLRTTAALDGVSAIDRTARLKFARQLLDQREPRAAIRKRLMVRYGIGRSQAYKIITEALQPGCPPSIGPHA
jgi:hypothetical protein